MDKQMTEIRIHFKAEQSESHTTADNNMVFTPPKPKFELVILVEPKEDVYLKIIDPESTVYVGFVFKPYKVYTIFILHFCVYY
jgi:glucose-6-phosphate 1-dehydrogenase